MPTPKNPDKTALTKQEKTLTYRDLSQRVESASAGLAAHVPASGRLAVILPSDFDHVVISLAAMRCGLTLIEIPHRAPGKEIAFHIQESRPDVIITHGATAEAHAEHLGSCPHVFVIGDIPDTAGSFRNAAEILLSGTTPGPATGLDILAAIPAQPAPELPFDPERDALIFFTSGSTGRPKGIRKSYRALLRGMQNRIPAMGLRETSVALCNEELNYTMGLLYLNAILYSGATAVLMDYDEQQYDRMLAMLRTHRITHIYSNPNLLFDMLEPEQTDASLFPALEFIAATGDLVTTRLKKLAFRKTGHRLTTIYAQSETGLIFMATDDGAYTNCPTIGNATSPQVEFKICDENLNPVTGPGIVGELLVRAPFMFSGYLGDPALTRDAITSDHYFRTGDLVSTGDDGRIYFEGRKNFMLTLATGDNVSPFEVEDAILETGLAEGVVVTGARTDDAAGTRIHAFVVLKSGGTPDAFLDQIKPALTPLLESFKIPDHFEFVPELRYSKRDKIDRAYYARAAAGNA